MNQPGPQPAGEPASPWLSDLARLLSLLGLAALGWSAVYALGALDLYLMLRRYSDVAYWEVAREFIPAAIAWVLLTPAVLRIHREQGFEEGRRSRVMARHLYLSLAFGLCLGTLEVVRILWVLGLPLSFFGEVLANYSNLRMLQHTGNYWLLIAVVVFADFYRSLRSGERQAQVLKSQLAEAQLTVLRARLHPHFLFNTFNAIASLVRSNQNARAVTMISDISTLLRHTLEHESLAEVSLQEELGFIDCYLGIEKARFGDRLHYRREIAPETLQAQVPNMILQPLVENAVKHGISRLTQPGEILVTAKRADSELLIEVRNTRPLKPSESPAPISLGIGLSTTRERLARAYGARASLHIQAELPEEFRVSIRLPLRTPGR